MKKRTEQAKIDYVKFSKICDTISYITENPSISFSKFDRKEINQLKFYMIRNHTIIQDTIVNYEINDDHYLSTQIPFKKFKKTDTIVVETKNHKYYQISDFHHYAYLHHAMFGYIGSYECRFDDENYMINGKSSNGELLQSEGVGNEVLPKK